MEESREGSNGSGQGKEGEERDVRGSNVGPEREQKRKDGVGRQ